jgi:hypothetical protein
MEKVRCQVRGKVAIDPDTGRIPWIMIDTAFREIPEDPTGGLTNAPPTCWACIPEALVTQLILQVHDLQPAAQS